MTVPLEYHPCVRRFLPASVALFSLLMVAVFFVSTSQAQINGVPSSVTSPGFGGRAVNGTPPSVTSLGPRGFAPAPGVTFSTSLGPERREGHEHHHHHFVQYAPPYVFAAVPYAIDIGATDDGAANDAEASDDDADYQGGPTVFDRRGQGEASYVPPARSSTPHRAARSAADDDPPAAPEPPQTPTLLVFKDGHSLEVGNYAIVGATLFDLTPGHARKVALADLDLDATRKQNDDRGVTFQLPLSPQAD